MKEPATKQRVEYYIIARPDWETWAGWYRDNTLEKMKARLKQDPSLGILVKCVIEPLYPEDQ